MNRKMIYLIFLVGLVVFLGLICLGRAERAAAPDPNLIRYALEQEPASLDPAKSTTLPESTVELQIFEGLTRLDKDNQPQPAAAQSWDISPDGTTYTFHLRKGMTWSNGDLLTAQDFAYAWLRALNPNTGADNAYMLYAIKNGEAYNSGKVPESTVGIKVLDQETLVVTLEEPAPYFLSLTAFHAFYPLNKKVVEAHPKDWASRPDTLVGNGPYKMTAWKHSGDMHFVKNESYWDAKSVKTQAMYWPISESSSTRLTLVEGGEADLMVEPPSLDQDRLTKAGLYKVSPMLGNYYYVFNVTAPPVNDPRVRKALSMVIDRKAIVDHVIHGGKRPAHAFIPPGMIESTTGKDFRQQGGDYVEENIAQAKALLKEAGYDKEHPLPAITILYNTNEMHKAVAEAVQERWRDTLGVDAILQNQESKVFLASRQEGHYQVARASWVADFEDPINFLEVFSAEDNDSQYHNPAYNDLIASIKKTQDPSRRYQLMHQAEEMIFQDALVIPFYYTSQPYVVSPRLTGYFITNMGLIDFKGAYQAY